MIQVRLRINYSPRRALDVSTPRLVELEELTGPVPFKDKIRLVFLDYPTLRSFRNFPLPNYVAWGAIPRGSRLSQATRVSNACGKRCPIGDRGYPLGQVSLNQISRSFRMASFPEMMCLIGFKSGNDPEWAAVKTYYRVFVTLSVSFCVVWSLRERSKS